jgi:hypothetical protein
MLYLAAPFKETLNAPGVVPAPEMVRGKSTVVNFESSLAGQEISATTFQVPAPPEVPGVVEVDEVLATVAT